MPPLSGRRGLFGEWRVVTGQLRRFSESRKTKPESTEEHGSLWVYPCRSVKSVFFCWCCPSEQLQLLGGFRWRIVANGTTRPRSPDPVFLFVLSHEHGQVLAVGLRAEVALAIKPLIERN